MHIERLTALANWLEGGAQHKLRIGNRDVVFDMNVGIKPLAGVGEEFDPSSCGTACCVAGAAVEFFAPEEATKLIQRSWEEAAGLIDDVITRGDDPTEMDDEWWNDALAIGFQGGDPEHPLIFEQAQKLLGLSHEQASMLFLPHEAIAGVGVDAPLIYDPPGHVELRDYTDPAWGARTIRHGLATGRFDWTETAQ